VEALLASLEQLHQDARGCRPVRVLELILERTDYAVWLATQQDGPARLGRIEELHAVVDGSPSPDLATWLADWHLGEVDGLADGQAEAVALTTIHSAKGAEWPVVFVVGLEEGLLPHGRPARIGESGPEDDEERRLTYVAFSRPQVLLYLTYCRTRRPVVDGQPGCPELRRPSRFLHPLPPQLIERIA
jgi:DNA helicase-2/ATP-dependent DNA helicase PcrA